MRFTSLFAELLRSRPGALVAAIVLAQALGWLVCAALFFASPPPGLGAFLARANGLALGPETGAPLAFWLGEAAFRLGGAFAVYGLAQLCVVASAAALFALGRAVMGRRHAALAVLLFAALWVYTFPPLEFSPWVLAMLLWALVALHFWRAVFEARAGSFLPLVLSAVLLLYTSLLAAALLVVPLIFLFATAAGRRALRRLPFAVAFLVGALLSVPFMLWLGRDVTLAAVVMPEAAPGFGLLRALSSWGAVASLALAVAGVAIIAFANRFGGAGKDPIAVTFVRSPMTGAAKVYVAALALVPLVLAFGAQNRFGVPAANGLAVLFVPLAVVALGGDAIRVQSATRLRTVWLAVTAAPLLAMLAGFLLMPWIAGAGVAMQAPGRAIGQFFAESFERRTGQPLAVVGGEARLATLVAMAAPGRPALVPRESEALSESEAALLRMRGGVVVWPASGATSAPPAAIAQRFPGLVPEVPQIFPLFLQGRQPPLRIGWAMIRPEAR